jgi:hypothetical protein
MACRRRKYVNTPEKRWSARNLFNWVNILKTAAKAGAVVSPYTPQNIDIAITHLERVLCAEGASSLFGQVYWRGRVLQAYATPGLMQRQRERLQRLLDRLASAPADSSPRTQAA